MLKCVWPAGCVAQVLCPGELQPPSGHLCYFHTKVYIGQISTVDSRTTYPNADETKSRIDALLRLGADATVTRHADDDLRDRPVSSLSLSQGGAAPPRGKLPAPLDSYV